MPLPLAAIAAPIASALVGGLAQRVGSKVVGPNAGQLFGNVGSLATQAVLQQSASGTGNLFSGPR